MNLLLVSIILFTLILVHGIYNLIADRLRQHLRRQLAEGLETLISSLQAGSSFPQALAFLAKEVQPPLQKYIDTWLKDYRLGLPFVQGLERLCTHAPLVEFRSLLAAIRMAQKSGGSLSQVLSRVATTLHDQIHMQQKAQALAAQAKLQAWVMTLLPFVLAVLMYTFDPPLMVDFFKSPFGHWVIAIIVISQTLAFWFVQRLIRIEI